MEMVHGLNLYVIFFVFKFSSLVLPFYFRVIDYIRLTLIVSLILSSARK